MLGVGIEALDYFVERAAEHWDPSNAAKLQTFVDDPENTLPSTTKLVIVGGGTSEDRKELCYSLRSKLNGLHTVIVIVSGEPSLFDTNGLVGIEKNVVETAETLVSLSGDPDYIILHGNFDDVEYAPLHGLFEVVFKKHYYARVEGDSVETNAINIFNRVMESMR
ncbi:MAG: hypothetical protein IJ757_07915 [Clostridiales bacterium]|nr:hypothetical protein [Clostridiales bacterium]